jgi:hypothetical protein
MTVALMAVVIGIPIGVLTAVSTRADYGLNALPSSSRHAGLRVGLLFIYIFAVICTTAHERQHGPEKRLTDMLTT